MPLGVLPCNLQAVATGLSNPDRSVKWQTYWQSLLFLSGTLRSIYYIDDGRPEGKRKSLLLIIVSCRLYIELFCRSWIFCVFFFGNRPLCHHSFPILSAQIKAGFGMPFCSLTIFRFSFQLFSGKWFSLVFLPYI